MKLLLSATLILSMAVLPAHAQNTHQEIINSLSESGIETYVNAPPCYENKKKAQGMYGIIPALGAVVVVCQDNRETMGVEVEWTANDYDTLRHEAFHAMQDCLDGEIDGELIAFYTTDDKVSFGDLVEAIGMDAASQIWTSYRSIGVGIGQSEREIEAFLAASTLSPEQIAKGIKDSCPVK